MDSKDIKISVVIPFYNNELSLITDAISSVERQNFPEYEIIVVDDGSDIEYHSALERLISSRDDIVLITTSNKGVSAARNTGIMQARGEYIAFLDADDYLSDSFFSEAYTIAKAHNADMVIGGVTQILDRSSGHNSDRRSHTPRVQILNNDDKDFIIKRFVDCYVPVIIDNASYIGRGPVSRLVRRELLLDNLFKTNLTIGEDMVWNIGVIRAANVVCIAYTSWYWYWQNPDSATHTPNPKAYEIWSALVETIAGYVELSNDEYYVSYVNRVYDGINKIWSTLPTSIKNSSEGKAIRKRLTREKPWTMLGERRYRKLASPKYVLYSILYKFRILFPLISLKNKLR